MSNLRHWLWLSTRGPAPGMYAARVLEHFGTPEGAYYADSAAYGQIPGSPGTVRQALEDKDLTPAETILAKCKEQGIWILTMQDAAYPQRLRQLESAPCVLYGKGTLPQLDHLPVVAIVGARKASPYGVMAARQFGLALARQGILVVSGSAYGVDAAALNGALRGGGEVVSVLGNGIDVTYPAGHEDLYADVAAAGALLSEYPPGTPPAGAHFPVRNRLIAGLSLGVLVVEGTETSGALITARWALEAGRDVFAVPGGIDAPLSRGPNGLIRRGEAKLVQDAWDIVEEYRALFPDTLQGKTPLAPPTAQTRLTQGMPVPQPLPPEEVPAPAEKRRRKPETPSPVPEPPQEDVSRPKLVIDPRQEEGALTEDQLVVLRALQGEKRLSAEELVEAAGIPARRVLSALTLLQIRQLVEEEGRRFSTPVELQEES